MAVAVRVSPELYNDINHDLLSGAERPSYGQLVIWTCEDHPEDVAEAIRSARPTARTRRPRGHRLAAPDVQITLRITMAERDLLDEIGRQADPDDGRPVTRTEVAIAALRQAIHHAADYAPSP